MCDQNKVKEEKENFKDLDAAYDFVNYNNFDKRGISFYVCFLEDALNEVCFTTLEQKKVLFLYFYNKNDNHTKIFIENLLKPEVKEIVNKRYFLLGWDIENEKYHPALITALNKYTELSQLVNILKSKTSGAFLIVPVKSSFTVFSFVKCKVSQKDFLETLRQAENFLITENEIETDLNKGAQSDDCMNPIRFHQMMLEFFCDRNYDSFDHYEFEHLERKIGYALYGPPQQVNGYDEKQRKKIQFLFAVIVRENNVFSKWQDVVVLSVVYNCTEPLPSDKLKRSKKYKDYDSNADFTPVPVFIIRKCEDSPSPCRIIIDDIGRVYKTWNEYLTRNKLPKCEMILPLNGRYQADENDKVILERHLSPACGLDVKVLQTVDVGSSVAGVVSGSVFIAAAIPAITVAPVALVTAGAVGIGVGLYSLGRSAYTLYDRKRHNEKMSFGNSEARGAYLSIVAGALGFVGAGANLALSQLATRGVNVWQGATTTVNVINAANVGASGVNVVNSGYDLFDQWFNENQSPSLLSVIQMGSSILFFGHAIYSFKSAGTIVKESQAQALREFQDSLRSNKHRKTFNKMTKETIRQNEGNVTKGQAEVIKTIRNINNKDEVFAILTRLNKNMNKNNVRFAADNGGITLNGVSVDVAQFGSMDDNKVTTFLSTLPSTPKPTEHDIRVMKTKFDVSFGGINSQDMTNLVLKVIQSFTNTEKTIKERILNAFIDVIKMLLCKHFDCFQKLLEMFWKFDLYMGVFKMVIDFFQKLIDEYEDKYQKWLATKDPDFEEPLFTTLDLDYSKRTLQIFNIVSEAYFSAFSLTEYGLNRLSEYFITWFAKQLVEFEEFNERIQKRVAHSSWVGRHIECLVCGGFYHLH